MVSMLWVYTTKKTLKNYTNIIEVTKMTAYSKTSKTTYKTTLRVAVAMSAAATKVSVVATAP